MSEIKRKHLRLPVETRTFIELEAPIVGQANTGKLITCKTQNVSREGLQITLAESVTVGAILQIGVDLPRFQNTLYLAGKVQWCLPVSEYELPWAAGFLIMNSQDSDMDVWLQLIGSMED